MRMTIMLIIGLLVGALGGVKAYQTLSARTAVPRAVMTLTGYHFGALGDAIKRGHCSADAVSSDVLAMSRLALDIEPVFLPADAPQDPIFVDSADKLREGIAAMQLAMGSCDSLAAARKETSETCKNCHRNYK